MSIKLLGNAVRLEKKLAPSPLAPVLIPLLSVLLALVTGGVFLLLTGSSPLEVYRGMLAGAFGSVYGLSETVVKAIPLILAGLGVSLAFRMQLWNIGAEGQLYMGAFAAGWVALTFPNAPKLVLLPAMFGAGFLAGGLWGLLPAIPRAFMKVNETITTLMLNYVAILWVNYLVYGPWKDPNGYNFPLSAPFTDAAILPALGNSRVHFGLVIGLVAALVVYIAVRRTKWGFEVRVIGESPKAARYAGMNIVKNILLVMFLSGGLAGLAGMAEVSGVIQRVTPEISSGYGYTAIIIAWLSKLNPWAIILVSFLFGGLQVGGYTIQSAEVPAAIVYMLQGSILFFVLGGEILNRYAIKFGRSGRD